MPALTHGWARRVSTSDFLLLKPSVFSLAIFYVSSFSIYSKTSITRTPMAPLPWLIRTRFESLGNCFDISRNTYLRIFEGNFLNLS